MVVLRDQSRTQDPTLFAAWFIHNFTDIIGDTFFTESQSLFRAQSFHALWHSTYGHPHMLLSTDGDCSSKALSSATSVSKIILPMHDLLSILPSCHYSWALEIDTNSMDSQLYRHHWRFCPSLILEAFAALFTSSHLFQMLPSQVFLPRRHFPPPHQSMVMVWFNYYLIDFTGGSACC